MICKFIIEESNKTQNILMLDIPSAKSEMDVKQIINKLVARQYRNYLCKNEQYDTTWSGLYLSFVEFTFMTALALRETNEITRYCLNEYAKDKTFDMLITVRGDVKINYIQFYESMIDNGETDMYNFCEKNSCV